MVKKADKVKQVLISYIGDVPFVHLSCTKFHWVWVLVCNSLQNNCTTERIWHGFHGLHGRKPIERIWHGFHGLHGRKLTINP